MPSASSARPSGMLALSLLALLLAAGVAHAAAPAKPARTAARAGSRAAAAAPGVPSLTLLYGDDHCFGIVPPRGWVIDDTSGLASKIRIVLYPKGQNWVYSPVVIYEAPMHKDRAHPQTLQELADRSSQNYLAHFPKGKVTPAPPVRTAQGKEATVVYRSHDGTQPDEAVAYFDEEGLVVMFVMSARTPSQFSGTIGTFRDLAASYQFVAANIETPTTDSPRDAAGKRR